MALIATANRPSIVSETGMSKLSNMMGWLSGGRLAWPAPGKSCLFRVRMATKLVLSFLLIILLVSGVFGLVGAWVIRNRVVAEAQARVQTDLNAAREIYLNKLASVNDRGALHGGSDAANERVAVG